MEKFFCMGVAFGMLAGALVAVNSYTVRKFVCEKQKKLKQEVEKMTENAKSEQEQEE